MLPFPEPWSWRGRNTMAVDPVVTSPAEVCVEPLAGPQIDVVITNHNYNHYVPGAVASALSQRGVLTRVFVVDD